MTILQFIFKQKNVIQQETVEEYTAHEWGERPYFEYLLCGVN